MAKTRVRQGDDRVIKLDEALSAKMGNCILRVSPAMKEACNILCRNLRRIRVRQRAKKLYRVVRVTHLLNPPCSVGTSRLAKP